MFFRNAQFRRKPFEYSQEILNEIVISVHTSIGKNNEPASSKYLHRRIILKAVNIDMNNTCSRFQSRLVWWQLNLKFMNIGYKVILVDRLDYVVVFENHFIFALSCHRSFHKTDRQDYFWRGKILLSTKIIPKPSQFSIFKHSVKQRSTKKNLNEINYVGSIILCDWKWESDLFQSILMIFVDRKI